MFEFSVSKNMVNENNNDKRRIPAHLLAYLLTLGVKELKISVEHGRVVTTLNIIYSTDASPPKLQKYDPTFICIVTDPQMPRATQHNSTRPQKKNSLCTICSNQFLQSLVTLQK